MGSATAAVLCLAFVFGLLLTAIPYGGVAGVGLGIAATFSVRRVWRTAPTRRVWLVAGAIALLATIYFQLRMPQPQATDVSKLLSGEERSLQVVVEGKVTSLPHLTRSEKAQFWLEAQRIAPIGDGKPVTGRVYTTVPFAQAANLHPGQIVSIAGALYLPQPATNPGGFDFQQYLQREGSFAGLRGEQVELQQDSTGWGWWQVQQRIVNSQRQGAGTSAGALISAMVLGGRTVDLPYEVKDAFVRVGLAHALAASGFQTSLILGVVLALTRRYAERVQFLAGSLSLTGFIGLAGLQPAVLRAGLMGFGSLMALVLGRKVKPLGSLLLTATILLLVNPIWIWDLGFQLSFLATIGLLVTSPPITKRLDWLPSPIAPLIAVPIAAYLWTLPLQLGAFGVLSPYSIPANLVTTPFISVISLGGMASALAALVWSPAGSAMAWALKYPTQMLIAIVNGFNQLPGNAFAIGTISVLIVVALYTLLGLATWQRWWQQRWWAALGISCGLLILPLWSGANLTQLTVLATPEPTMVVRDRGRVTVMGGSDAQTVQFTLLPYFQKTGVNQIDWAIALNRSSELEELCNAISVKYLLKSPTVEAVHTADGKQPTTIALPLNQMVRLGSTQLNLLSAEPAIAQFTLHNQTWLWLGRLNASQQKALLNVKLPQAQVLWWTGKSLRSEIIEAVKPTVAIASAQSINQDTTNYLQQHNIQLHVTGRDGAIQWTPAGGFTTAIDGEGE